MKSKETSSASQAQEIAPEYKQWRFEPIRNLATGKVFYYEMLMPISMARGHPSVEAHVQWLESTGKIVDHDRLAIEIGTEILLGDPHLVLGVNVSPRTIPYAAEFLSGIPLEASRRLVIEITENHREDKKYSYQLMLALSRIGTKVALDDYGSGVREGLGDLTIGGLLPDIIKFANPMLPRKHIESAMHYAAKLGITAVMEKIEDDAALRLCNDFGISCGQGYLLNGTR